MSRRVLTLLLCLAPPVSAADFYVDPVSGSDAGNGSAASPWRTLQAVLDGHRIETRNWASIPYHPGASLVTINAGAPVKAGDTLWLRSGDHGAVRVRGAYNAAPITIAAQAGHTPRLRSLVVEAAQNWILTGLSISPSYAPPPLSQGTIVSISDHNWYGPAWDVEIHDSDVFTAVETSSWGAHEWVNVASSGVSVRAARVTVLGCRIRNVRHGIEVTGADARIQENLIENFSADGMRGLGDNGLFEYNRVQNSLIGDSDDPNHDDGFQSWSVGPGGVGTGEVRGVTLRGNVIISHLNPNHPLRGGMQGIGCFDGLFVGWVVENNVVINDHWHGISLYGLRDSRVVNNTAIDVNQVSPGPPWIMVHAHKDGRPSQNVVVRNNLATDFSLTGTNIVSDHNLEFTMATAPSLFVAPPYDLHLRPGTAAVDTGSNDLAPALDVEGIPRPQGSAVDRGAHERVAPTLWASKTVAGLLGPGGSVTYTLSLVRPGPATPGTSHAELTDTLPSELTLTQATASSGSVGSSGNTVTWTGSVAPLVPVEVKLKATIGSATVGQRISNQGTVRFDGEGVGELDAVALTDDPGQPGLADATVFDVGTGRVSYHTLKPCRLVDTRGPSGLLGGPALAGQAERVFGLRGVCGVPATAKALAVNLTVTEATAPGHLRLNLPGSPSNTSVINFMPGATRANNALLVLDASGSEGVFCGQSAGGSVHFILDVQGFFE